MSFPLSHWELTLMLHLTPPGLSQVPAKLSQVAKQTHRVKWCVCLHARVCAHEMKERDLTTSVFPVQ